MTDPPVAAIKRLVDALQKVESTEIPPRLPAWRGFVREWWEECEPEMRRASQRPEELYAARRQKISDIVENILPQRSLGSGEVSRFLSSPFHSTEYDPASGILYEVGPPDGAQRRARPEILGPHGLWEKLTPLRCATREEELASLTARYALRSDAQKLVRDALTQELEGQAGFADRRGDWQREADREGTADQQRDCYAIAKNRILSDALSYIAVRRGSTPDNELTLEAWREVARPQGWMDFGEFSDRVEERLRQGEPEKAEKEWTKGGEIFTQPEAPIKTEPNQISTQAPMLPNEGTEQLSRGPTPEQAKAAEELIDREQDVDVQHAAWYLRCSRKHVLRLISQKVLIASNTRPKRITSESLKTYKWRPASQADLRSDET